MVRVSTFSGWLFENFVHEKLLEGGTFQIRKAGETPCDGVVWMFSITRISDHDVKLAGIRTILQYLSCYDGVKANVGLAKLIFVVPTQQEKNYPKQNLTTPARMNVGETDIGSQL